MRLVMIGGLPGGAAHGLFAGAGRAGESELGSARFPSDFMASAPADPGGGHGSPRVDRALSNDSNDARRLRIQFMERK